MLDKWGTLCETHPDSCRIWTQVAVSISYKDTIYAIRYKILLVLLIKDSLLTIIFDVFIITYKLTYYAESWGGTVIV